MNLNQLNQLNQLRDKLYATTFSRTFSDVILSNVNSQILSKIWLNTESNIHNRLLNRVDQIRINVRQQLVYDKHIDDRPIEIK